MKEHRTPRPPRLALRWFRFFCLATWADDIEGDLRQYYERRVETHGKRRADLLFYRDVMLLFRPGLIRSFRLSQQLNIMDLFKHNLKSSLRSFRKYRGSFLINILGLSSGMACVLLIYLWVFDELSIDQYHLNNDRLYQILENVDQGGGVITRESTSGPMAKALEEEFPEVERAVTATWVMEHMLSVEDKRLKAEGIYAHDGYFDLFTYEWLEGSPGQLLNDKTAIVVSDDLARRLFGTTEAILGRSLEWQYEKTLQIKGVYKQPPGTASKRFDYVLPFEVFWEEHEWVQNWYNTAPSTYVMLREGASLDAFNEKLWDLIRTKTEGNAAHRSPFAALYKARYLHGNYEEGLQSGGRIDYVKMFSTIALFILLIACINFINLTTAMASKKMKEIGIRKTVGASRPIMVFQFFSEAILLTLFSTLVALIAVWLLLPWFNLLTGKELALLPNVPLVVGLLTIVLVTSFVAGSYPALYLSRFDPAKALKAPSEQLGRRSWSRRGLVTFQFILSVVMIVAVIVIYRQLAFTQNEHLGYDREHMLIFPTQGALTDSASFATYLGELQRLPGVVGAVGSDHSMTGHNGGTYGVHWLNKDPDDRTEFERFFASADFIDVMGIEVIKGRGFREGFVSDLDKIIFNEAAIAHMGLEDPIGQKIRLWGDDLEIIGVIKNFNFQSLHEKVTPAFIRPTSRFNDFAIVKVNPEQQAQVLKGIEQLHETMNPGYILDYRFLDDQYQQMYQAEQRVSSLSSAFAIMAILISCLGLFGLASFTLERRSKEIGIRKILGSSQSALLRLLTLDLTKMVFVAILLGLPISYFVTNSWLESFAFRIDLEWWFFVGAGVLTVSIAIITVSVQAIKATLVSPVRYLRDE